MRCSGSFCSVLCAALLTGGVVQAQQARPYIYGCGITWGQWLGLPTAQAKQFDRNSMDKIVQMGGTNCPANFAWIGIETSPGVFDWDYVDHQVNEALSRGLQIFAYTGLTPDWALPPGILAQYGSGIGYRFPPGDAYIPRFESFFQTLAARYRGRVKYYEFWNEPNGCSWINDGCANGQMAYTYVPWLKRWYTAMKQGDPDCVLATGGLDYNSGVTNGYQYIEDIYTNGGGDSFDAVAIHPYGSPLNWNAITQTYNVLVQHGQGNKKLWLNEYGWNEAESNKAADLTTVLTQLKQPQYDMVFMANHLVLTDLPGTPDNGNDYGLCSRNTSTLAITPRQSWNAFQALDKTWPITIDFIANPTSGGAPPLPVQFTDQSYYPGATTWLWDFGDGQTSTQTNPAHTYQAAGNYTVSLTRNGPSGLKNLQKSNYIQVGSIPIPGVANPSFENGGGSLTGWTISVLTGGIDNPPLANGSFGVNTTAGTHWAGKVTSLGTFNLQIGQVIGTSQWKSLSPKANWQLNSLVQLHSRHNTAPTARPTNVHQLWEIGWNNDGLTPASVSSCDRYQTITTIDGNFTSNNAGSFVPLTASGTLTVPGLRGVALRVRLYNDFAVQWSFSNIDNIDLVVTSAPPIPGDRDADGDVDPTDVTQFAACRTGPSVGPPSVGCTWADFDQDVDVDQNDFGILQRCFSGVGKPGNPSCAG